VRSGGPASPTDFRGALSSLRRRHAAANARANSCPTTAAVCPTTGGPGPLSRAYASAPTGRDRHEVGATHTIARGRSYGHGTTPISLPRARDRPVRAVFTGEIAEDNRERERGCRPAREHATDEDEARERNEERERERARETRREERESYFAWRLAGTAHASEGACTRAHRLLDKSSPLLWPLSVSISSGIRRILRVILQTRLLPHSRYRSAHVIEAARLIGDQCRAGARYVTLGISRNRSLA